MRKENSIRKKIIGIICGMIVFVSIALGLISYKAYYDAHIQFYYDKALGIVKLLASEVDSERIDYYVQTGDKDSEYIKMQEHFNNVKTNTSDLNYLYLFVPYEDYFIYVLDAYTEWDDMNRISGLGDQFNYTETEYTYLIRDIEAKSASTRIVKGDDVGFGDYIAVWAPVIDENGNVIAMVEADYCITDLQNNINNYMFKVILFLMAAIVIITIIMIKVMDISVIHPILQLTHYVKSYKSGEFEVSKLNMKDNNEIQLLADSFDDMIEKIKVYVEDIERVTAEKERIGAELSIATQIQADMLPCIFPPFPERTEIDLYASMTPAKEVGGDFYDFFLIDDNHLALVIADVSGKGVPAALFMVIAKTLLKNQLQLGASPGEALAIVNNQLCENNEAEMFVTVWLGVYEISTGILTAANAGHEYPAIKRANGKYELYKDKHGIVLAAMEGVRYKEYEIKMEAGDELFVYTDGVAEATNIKQELYGTDRMIKALNHTEGENAQGLLERMKYEIDCFAGEAPQFDDITMLVFHVNEV